MADSAASPQSRPSRAASAKRRTASVSTDTENRLARAARSAQRLAQLSDVARDDNTLDLFPDDPTRATLEAMNIDLRQRTLDGFELPDVVLAAVGALDPAAAAPIEAKAARRAPRAAKLEKTAAPKAVDAIEAPRDAEREGLADMSADGSSVASMAMGLVAQDRAAIPSRSGSAGASALAAARFDDLAVGVAGVAEGAGLSPVEPAVKPIADTASSATESSGIASIGQTARADAPASHATAPELDRARATAFADTVDALYGVIADQRRAATDHSRRMKWMLSIVVGALLATIAIGIAQTALLLRLTRETAAQQQRIGQMMQRQQTALGNLLDAHREMAAVPSAASALAASAAAAPRLLPAQQPEAATRPISNQHGAHAQHTHKVKAANPR